MKLRTIASIFLVALPAITLAQTSTLERRVTGKADANINAGAFLPEVRSDCTADAAPVVHLVTPPAHGNVTIAQGHVPANCPGMKFSGWVAFYRSAKGFRGQDNFTLEVKDAAGETKIQQITVTVF